MAEQTVNSSTAGIINATTPLWTVLLALAVRHQKAVTSWQAACQLLAASVSWDYETVASGQRYHAMSKAPFS
jgi:drug/metabolite transporter (DMT)-like permease